MNCSTNLIDSTTKTSDMEKPKSTETELPKLDSDDQKNLPFFSEMKLILTNITVEPIMVAVILPGMMSILTTQNLVLEKCCRVNLALGNEICDALTNGNESYPNYKAHEANVQKLATKITTGVNILQSLFPAILLLFLGSWSDRHNKRKPCVMMSLTGEICICVGLLFSNYFFYELPAEFIIIFQGLPSIFSGGWCSLFLGCYSYISNVSTEETRTVRIGACHTLFGISFCIGISLSGIVFQMLGYYGMYILALSINLCGFIYGTFFLKDICDLEQNYEEKLLNEKTKKNLIVDFFDFKTILKTLKLTFKDDGNKRRLKMSLIFILGYVSLAPMTGELNISYFFTRHKFGWNSVDYSMFSTFQFVATALGSLLTLTFLAKVVQLDDSIVGTMAVISKFTGSIIFAFAPTALIFYIGALAELFQNLSFICMRSIISKLIPPDELGAVNSIIGVSEAFIPLLIGPTYNKLYAVTILYFPGSCYLLSAGIVLPGLFVYLWLYTESKKPNAEDLLDNSALLNPDNIKGNMDKNGVNQADYSDTFIC